MTQPIRISSNPEGLIVAPIGSFFYRRGEKYFLINGDTEVEEQLFTVNKATFFRKYHNPDFYKKYSVEYIEDIETWVKIDQSRGDKYGWQFVAYRPPTFVGEQVIPPTPTPIASFTPTPTPTPSATPDPTPSPTPAETPSVTPTPSSTPTTITTPEFFAIGYAAGTGTNFMKSADGVNWASRYVDNQGQLLAIECGNNTLVALESGYTSDNSSIDPSESYADIHVSNDFGDTWTTIQHSDFFPTGGHLWADVVHVNGKFVVLSEQGAVITSNDDGQSWTASAELLGSSLHRAAVKGDTIVQLSAGFYSGSDYQNNYHVKVSFDAGQTWQFSAATNIASGSDFDENWTGICVDPDGFNAVAPYRSGSIMYSPDGMNWSRWTDISGSNLPIRGFDIAYGHVGYLIVEGDGSSVVWHVGESTNWDPVERSGSLPAEGDWRNITYGNGVYVAVNADANSGPAAMYSSDGINWTDCNGASNSVQWVDVKHADMAKVGRYYLDISSYPSLGTVPHWRNDGFSYYYPYGDFALDGNIYIWKVTGTVETGSLFCSNVRNLIGKINVSAQSVSPVDITDILSRETYGPNTAIVFTTVGDANSSTNDMMSNATLSSKFGSVNERLVRRIPYLTVGNSGYPQMLYIDENNHYTSGNANFANGIEILDFENCGAVIQLANGYPVDGPLIVEYSQDPIVRYTLNASNLESISYISSESFNGLMYYPSGSITNGSQINIWKVSGSIVSGSMVSYSSRSLIDTIYTFNYSDSSSIDITATIILNAEYGKTDSGIVFTTVGDFSSKSWEIMTSASVINTSGSSIESIGVHAIPHGELNMVGIQETGSSNLVGEVGFAGGILFPSTYNSIAKIVLNNGYPIPSPYVELSPKYMMLTNFGDIVLGTDGALYANGSNIGYDGSTAIPHWNYPLLRFDVRSNPTGSEITSSIGGGILTYGKNIGEMSATETGIVVTSFDGGTLTYVNYDGTVKSTFIANAYISNPIRVGDNVFFTVNSYDETCKSGIYKISPNGDTQLWIETSVLADMVFNSIDNTLWTIENTGYSSQPGTLLRVSTETPTSMSYTPAYTTQAPCMTCVDGALYIGSTGVGNVSYIHIVQTSDPSQWSRTDVSVSRISDIKSSNSGTIYISSDGSYAIYIVDKVTGNVTQLTSGYSVKSPNKMIVSEDGYIYVVSRTRDGIQRVNIATGETTDWAQWGFGHPVVG